MSAFLPQHDPDPAARERLLKSAQEEYEYNYTYVSPLAIVERVPVKDEFSLQWLMAVSERLSHALANRAELEGRSQFRDLHVVKRELLHTLLAAGEGMIGGLKHMVAEFLKFDVRVGAPDARPQALDDYGALFRAIGLPPVANDYADDRAFAWLRVAGPNPVMLRRMTARDDRLRMSDADFAAIVPGDSFDLAIAEERLYLADYAVLHGAEQGDYPHGQKYLYAPLALFVIDKQSRALSPVAIQCRQEPAPDNPIFTPRDGYNWLIAKTIVEIADANVHEAFTHLARTHLFMEPFVISTFRQLACNHPLGLLLALPFEGTLAINEAAWKHLIAQKGAVDKLCGGSIGASRGLAARGVQTNLVTRAMFPLTFADRGVDDAEVFPHYPYRDDALLYWDAVGQWVSSYLRLYYETDLDVQEDVELQSWSRELAAQDGGRINGLPNGGSLKSLAELGDVLTLVLMTCSVQHAAVNFPQYDVMSYVPQMPLAGYAPAPTTKTGGTQEHYLAMLPTLDMAELQVELGYMLGSVRYTQLGQYAAHQFPDPRVAAPLLDFQNRIGAIGAAITERNRQRPRPYEFLVPSGIPQSINI